MIELICSHLAASEVIVCAKRRQVIAMFAPIEGNEVVRCDDFPNSWEFESVEGPGRRIFHKGADLGHQARTLLRGASLVGGVSPSQLLDCDTNGSSAHRSEDIEGCPEGTVVASGNVPRCKAKRHVQIMDVVGGATRHWKPIRALHPGLSSGCVE